jgi:hypothetical protein
MHSTMAAPELSIQFRRVCWIGLASLVWTVKTGKLYF